MIQGEYILYVCISSHNNALSVEYLYNMSSAIF